MNLSNFLDLGFNIIYEEQNPRGNWAFVMREDPIYKQVFEFCKTCDNHTDIEKYLNTLDGKYNLRSRLYSNNQLERIYLTKEYNTLQVYTVENNGIKLHLIVDKDSKEVYTIEDVTWYFHSICSYRTIWEKDSIYDDTTVESCLATVYRFREANANAIREYYSKEIKKLKNAYKRDYKASQIGIDYLAQFKEV